MKTIMKKAQNGANEKKSLSPAPNKKTGMDAVKELGKYVSTFGGATERDDPKQKDINIVKKLKKTGNKFKNKLNLKTGGSLKPVAANQKGLAKLPTPVRNKMGYAKNGAATKMKMGGMCGMKAGGKIKAKK